MSAQSLKPRWKMVKFGEVVKDANLVERDPEANNIERVVGLEHIDPENLHIRRWNSVSDGSSFTRKFVQGQTLFGKRRAYQRKVAYAEFEGICSGDILTFEPKNTKVLLPELLPFICQSDAFFDHALGTSAGSLSPRTSWKALKEFEFPLPPLDEQKRIAEILWAADEAVEAYESVTQNIERAINAYSDKKLLLHEARKKKPNIPSGWRIGFLHEIAQIDPPMPKGLPDDLEISFVPMESVDEEGSISKLEIKKLGEVRKGYTYFEENDVLFAKITPCMENGKGAIAVSLKNNKGMGSTEYYVFRAIKSEDTQFIYHLTMSGVFRKRAEKWMQGSAGHRRVPKDFFARRAIVIPDSESRRKISFVLNSLQSQKFEARRHIDVIRKILAVFLQKSLSQTGAAHV
ncbi:MAG: restriction endonuclease subunit S [Candidatus Hydrogenedentales bacterium]|jgi:restriction endonuclease S subunit